jgi:hypothetical protein
MLDTSNDAICDKKVSFGDLIDEKDFSGGTCFPETFKRAFCMQIEIVE